MGLISYINEKRKNFLRNQIAKVNIPEFEKSSRIRKRIIFSGKVQRVGFRVEVHEMGKRLELTGWVKNNEDKTVEAEIQGEENRIDFLIEYLKSIKRIKIKDMEVENIPIVQGEDEFKVIL